MIEFFKKNKISIIFIVLFITTCFTYQYHVIIFLKAQGIHLWRQAIGVSYALNYYQQGMNFFMPATNLMEADGGTTGYTAAEFPLLYYINAGLWKIFGVNDFIPRFMSVLPILLGFFFVHKIIYKFSDAFWAITLPLFLFTSPFLIFYGISTLPDGPAFGLALISLYFFYLFMEEEKYKWLYVFMFLSLMAGLLKATSAMVFGAVFGIFILEKIGIHFKSDKKIFNGGLKDYLLFIGVIIGIATWYVWASFYNKEHGLIISDSKILPIWDMSLERMEVTIRGVHEINWYQFLSPHSTFLILLSFIGLILLKNKTNKFWWTITLLLFAGSIAYILLWFLVWGNHDYYMFPLYFFVISVAITFIEYLRTHHPTIHSSNVLKTIFFLFFVYNVWYCGNNIRMRFGLIKGDGGSEEFYKEIILTSTKPEIGFWDWFNWDYHAKWEPYQNIEPYNRSLGIKQSDLVISIPDESICASLYFMNQRGWTAYGSNYTEQEGITDKLKLGANYLFIGDTTMMKNNFIAPFVKHKIGQYRNVAVFDLRPYK